MMASLAVWISGLGNFAFFVFDTLRFSLRDIASFRIKESLDEIYELAVKSIPSVFMAVGFLSVVLVSELAYHMRLVIHQDSMVAPFTMVLLIRELVPVVTAMIVASRAGAGIAAELASMKQTSQIDALYFLGVDPISFIVLPRLIACQCGVLCLYILSLAVAVLVSAFFAASTLGLTPALFLSNVFLFVERSDLMLGTVKAFVFGVMIGFIACYQGLNASRGSRGVGVAAARCVVYIFIGIIVMDLLVTYLWYAV
jgi:phospholipid/cholesterol/gamma-HCH transport system permease protein